MLVAGLVMELMTHHKQGAAIMHPTHPIDCANKVQQ
jgi:hypothetical protein